VNIFEGVDLMRAGRSCTSVIRRAGSVRVDMIRKEGEWLAGRSKKSKQIRSSRVSIDLFVLDLPSHNRTIPNIPPSTTPSSSSGFPSPSQLSTFPFAPHLIKTPVLSSVRTSSSSSPVGCCGRIKTPSFPTVSSRRRYS